MENEILNARGPEISFRNVRLTLGGLSLLNDVSLQVSSGTIHALIGPNGAGKTSLLRCLLGQLPHTGDIALRWLGGRSGRVGYVPQTLDFDRYLPVTVQDFLGLVTQRSPLFFGLADSARMQIAKALVHVDLTERRHTRLGALSGGELKRVLLAQALLPEPDLLILDEPMNHLDTPGVALASTLLFKLKSHGVTVLLTLHDLAHVRALADVVTGMATGQVVFSGATGSVLTPESVVALYTGSFPSSREGAA